MQRERERERERDLEKEPQVLRLARLHEELPLHTAQHKRRTGHQLRRGIPQLARLAREAHRVVTARQTDRPAHDLHVGIQADAKVCVRLGHGARKRLKTAAVSYTHLTLPTICSV